MRSSSSCSTSGPPAKRRKPNSKHCAQRSPFTDIGSYMAVKNRKLRSQFEAEASSSSFLDCAPSSSGEVKGIFHGISIFIDGHTVPSSQELRGFMLKFGGNVENYFSKSRVTHIICSNLSDSKMKNLRAFSRGLPVLKPAWIVDSVAANKLLSWLPYQLIEQSSELYKQQKLSSFFGCKPISSDVGLYEDTDSEGLKKCSDLIFFEENKVFGGQMEREKLELELNNEAKFSPLLNEGTNEVSSNSGVVPLSIRSYSNANDISSKEGHLHASHMHRSTLTHPNFVENYFKRILPLYICIVNPAIKAALYWDMEK